MRKDDLPDYYELLGVSREASKEDIKKAYRALGKELHPDVNDDPEAQERFKSISQAYEVLSNDEKRQKYDGISSGHQDISDVHEFFRRNFGFDFSSFGNFSVRFSSSRMQTNSDIEISVPMTMKELLTGKKDVQVSYVRMVFCSNCNGVGGEGDGCEECEGKGYIEKGVRFVCNRCSGTGTVINKICESCGGNSVIQERKTLSVDLPPGMNMSPFVISGHGNAEMSAHPAGNLVISPSVSVINDLSVVRGCNIQMISPIDPVMFSIGGRVSILTPFEEEIDVEIPRTAPYGYVARIEGMGLPMSFSLSEPRGFLMLKFIPKEPTGLTTEQEGLLKEYARSRGLMIEAGILDEEKEYDEMNHKGGGPNANGEEGKCEDWADRGGQ